MNTYLGSNEQNIALKELGDERIKDLRQCSKQTLEKGSLKFEV
jgi:hypothetical protein